MVHAKIIIILKETDKKKLKEQRTASMQPVFFMAAMIDSWPGNLGNMLDATSVHDVLRHSSSRESASEKDNNVPSS